MTMREVREARIEIVSADQLTMDQVVEYEFDDPVPLIGILIVCQEPES